MKKTIHILGQKDGASIGLGVLLALLIQGQLIIMATYITQIFIKGSTYNSLAPTANFKDGFLTPAIVLLVGFLLIEASLWLLSYLRSAIK